MGAIAKVTNEVRLAAYESSTWYNLSDEFSQNLIAVSSNVDGDLHKMSLTESRISMRPTNYKRQAR
jgi:hypothetical protein